MTPEVLEISGCPMYLPCMGSDLDEKGLEDATPAHQCVDRFLFPPVEPSQTLEFLSGSSGTGAIRCLVSCSPMRWSIVELSSKWNPEKSFQRQLAIMQGCTRLLPSWGNWTTCFFAVP